MCQVAHPIRVGIRTPFARRSGTTVDLLRLPGRAPGAAARLATGGAALVLMTLAGCSAPAPKDYGGSWAPVNRFQNAPTEIPLSPVYTFYASPMDATLQAMLKRWAADNGLQLAYQLGSDFTLHQPVAKVRTTDLQVAVSELSAIYAPQGVAVMTDGKRILVQSTSAVPITSGSR